MDEKTGDEKPQGEPAGQHDVASEQFRAQLDQMAQVFSKNLPASNAYLAGGLPFPLPFPNAYMLPAMMQYSNLASFYAPGTASVDADFPSRSQGRTKAHLSATKAQSSPTWKTSLETKQGDSVSKGQQASENMGSASQKTALSLLASTAGRATGTGSLGLGPPIVRPELQPSGLELAKRSNSTPEQGIMTVDELDAAVLAGMDERDVKRLKRKQSNRESARRSRLRKQAECEQLQLENSMLREELHRLRHEQVEMKAQISLLQAKLQASGKTNGES